MVPEGRVCNRCGVWKPRTDYHKKLNGIAARCKDCVKEVESVRRQSRREEARERTRKWREDNPERVREYHQDPERKRRNRDRMREAYRENPQKFLDRNKKWRKNNPEKAALNRDRHSQDRRARKKALPLEKYTRVEIFDRDGWVCKLCNEPIPLVTLWPHPLSPSIDHIVPVNHPDCPGDIPSNVQASHLTCNVSKQDKYGE